MDSNQSAVANKSIDRQALRSAHPVANRYIVSTPMLRSTYVEVKERVSDRRTGALFHGRTRMGKTVTARYCKERLAIEFPQSYITSISMVREDGTKPEGIGRTILNASHLAYPEKAVAQKLRNRIVADIVAHCEMSHGNQYIIIIDEANNLTTTDFHQLVGIQNAVDANSIDMTTILFAQESVFNILTLLKSGKEDQVLARFSRSTYQFYGCRDVTQFMDILREYDVNSEWPDGSGISYTAFFYPYAFDRGFRLANFADDIWTKINATKTVTSEGLDMEVLTLIIKHLLLDYSNEDHPAFAFDGDHILRAIRKSDYGIDVTHQKLTPNSSPNAS